VVPNSFAAAYDCGERRDTGGLICDLRMALREPSIVLGKSAGMLVLKILKMSRQER